MKLHIPSSVPYTEEEPDGEHQMSMEDYVILKRVMLRFDTFAHLEHYVKDGKVEQRHALRNVDILEWLDPDPERWPKGGLRDSFIAVLNVFAEEYEKKGVLPTGLPFDYLVAKASEDLAITERSMKPKIKSLIKGKYLDLSYGNVLYPIARGKS
jgi:hypothetical protein